MSGSHVCSGKIGTLTANAIGECEEQPSPGGGGESAFGDLDEVERHLADRCPWQERCGDDADEHERRTDHREEEELRGRVDAAFVSPPGDQEVHRHEHDLEEDEEQEEVEADEAPISPASSSSIHAR